MGILNKIFFFFFLKTLQMKKELIDGLLQESSVLSRTALWNWIVQWSRGMDLGGQKSFSLKMNSLAAATQDCSAQTK